MKVLSCTAEAKFKKLVLKQKFRCYYNTLRFIEKKKFL